MPQAEIAFVPSPDVSLLLNRLLDTYERRSTPARIEGRQMRSIRVMLDEVGLAGYFSQVDPEPRQVANEQLQALERAGLLRLNWHPGEQGHLLEAVAMIPGSEDRLYTLVRRAPLAGLRARLESLLLGERFRFKEDDWRLRAIQAVLRQIKEGKSPAPLSLTDVAFNEDLIAALVNLDGLDEETPFRVFSVHTFNDSKRFEEIRPALVRLARLGQGEWKRLPEDELLREINLVANPTYLLMSGDWSLVDGEGQALSLGEFSPSVGVPAVQAAHLQRASVRSGSVLCIENLTTFHSAAQDLVTSRSQVSALVCLAGNPSPACRWLLRCLVDSLPEQIPLYVWADLDYGGFNILAQLRKQVSDRFVPYRMDIQTLERYSQFARPLTEGDIRNLGRLEKHTELKDVHPVLAYMLQKGIKLEQEAVSF